MGGSKLKVAAILALAVLPLQAIAQQHPVYVAGFNGFYLAISFSTPDEAPDFSPADKKAAEVCQSVGRSAELQRREEVRAHGFILYYLCL